VYLTSRVTGEGLAEVDALLQPGLTVALLGSSGVGKSTLANRWIEEEQAVAEVDDFGRGRHTTTSRSIFRTHGGALLLDTPGMRELALWDADEGVRVTFPDVEAVAGKCKFRDCAHENEPGCAIREALSAGVLPRERVESWKKLREELAEIERRRAARGSVEEKRSQRTMQRALRARLKDKGR
jgi:ribosome biogenesis GTPase